MPRQVQFTVQAEEEFESAHSWWAMNRSRAQADRWYISFTEKIRTLASDAEQCPLARENDLFPYEVRDLHYGLGRRPTHRAVFTIRPDDVLVLSIRHLAQRNLTSDDLPV